MDRLYLDDNLAVLREHVASESIDLIYLDPPFNTNAIYKTIVKHGGRYAPDEEVAAFSDIWKWGSDAAAAIEQIAKDHNHTLGTLMTALRAVIGPNAMMAYVAMMSVRLLELQRVLKPGGSLYLHCDPTASHYLKLVLDAIFGADSFRREIIWRSGWVSGFKTRTNNWIRNHDTILYYLKSPASELTFNKQYIPHPTNYHRRGGGANPLGKAVDDVWDDARLYSPNIKSFATEKLGYPTQKPVALLERIIATSSKPGDVVLDPFCGCGTTLDAAQKLGRRWVGIDKSHLAIGLTEKRLRESYGRALSYHAIGVPHDLPTSQRLFTDRPDDFRAWLVFRLGGWLAGKGEAAVDGHFYFTRRGQTESGIIAVALDPGSEKSAMGRLSRLIMQDDGAAMGLLVTASGGARSLNEQAVIHGRIATDAGLFPKIQTFTLERLFAGEAPDLPPLVSPHRRTTRAKAGTPAIGKAGKVVPA